MAARMLYLHALTPVHSGTGQGTGVVDLPIARSKVTGRPIIPGSAIKGVLRGYGWKENEALARVVFGPESNNTDPNHDRAGAIWFTDAHLLCLPVRSLYGSFAWITSPMVLRNWLRDLNGAGQHALNEKDLPSFRPTQPAAGTDGDAADGAPAPDKDELKAFVPTAGSVIAHGNGNDKKLYLEEIDLPSFPNSRASALAKAIAEAAFADPGWQAEFQKRFAIVPDGVFEFLATHAVEIIARIRLRDDTKTVADGALWYEEAVPAESIFAAPLIAGDVTLAAGTTHDTLFDHIGAILDDPGIVLQFGGNASVGRGLMEGRLVK